VATQNKASTNGRAGVVAEHDQGPASQLDRNGERQELAGDAKGLHVSKRSRVARELAPGFMQEDRRQQQTAGKRRRLLER
jgi:hypothetical protein